MVYINTSFLEEKFNIHPRPNVSPGLWLMFLLPLAIITSYFKHSLEATFYYKLAVYLAVGFIITSCKFVNNCKQKSLLSSTSLFLNGIILGIIIYIFFKNDFGFSFSCSLISTVGYYRFYLFVLNNLPQCFTLGEAAIFAQSFILWIYFAITNTFQCFFTSPKSNMAKATIIIEIGLFGIGLIALLVYKFNIRKPLKFYLTTFFVLVFQVLIPLQVVLKQNAIFWIFNLVIEDLALLKLFCYWIICVCCAILAIMRQIKGAKKASTSTRKIFHILAVAVYLPGLLYNCLFIYLASGVILGIFFYLEILRITKIPPLNKHLEDGLIVYGDEKDSGILALTPIYLLVGCSLPLWIHPSPCDLTNSAGYNLLPLLSGILTIGIGDTCASFFGSKFGRYHWSGSVKTIEGTLACLFGQVLLVALLYNLGFIYYYKIDNLIKIALAIVLTSVIEAKTDQIDNIVLPLVMYIILIF